MCWPDPDRSPYLDHGLFVLNRTGEEHLDKEKQNDLELRHQKDIVHFDMSY